MTTITIHRIDVSDISTLRLRCAKCNRLSLAEVGEWNSHGGRARCPHCNEDWGVAGTSLASLMAGLNELHQSEKPGVHIQVEIEAGASAPTP